MKARIRIEVELESGGLTGATRTIDYTPHSGSGRILIAEAAGRMVEDVVSTLGAGT